MKRIVCLVFYYGFLRYLPASSTPVIGSFFRYLRYCCCRHIFKYCGKNVNIERGAYFGTGKEIEIGDNSGLGINSFVPRNIKIGKNVMMGPNCYILSINHRFDRVDIPMIEQGSTSPKGAVIGDDVWIGRNVTFTPGRIVNEGTIIAACSVVSKDFPSYTILGGNPVRVIRMRK